MKSISQVAKLTGVSVRTLQYYDEIGLLKPSKLTSSGYRLYNDEALQTLQQILFFKELGFHLKEISEILRKPDFDKIAAFKKQKDMFLLKRNRIDRLIQLLDRLEKGEQYMSFKEFDLSDYVNALEDFKSINASEIVKHWGSVENFDMLIQKIKDDEDEVAKLAIKQFGSTEKYTEAMKYNLDHFSELMEKQLSDMPKSAYQIDDLYRQLVSDTKKALCSDEIQCIVQKIVSLMLENTSVDLLEKNYWDTIIETYSNDYIKTITDTKYGAGASDYIVKAFRYYSENRRM